MPLPFVPVLHVQMFWARSFLYLKIEGGTVSMLFYFYCIWTVYEYIQLIYSRSIYSVYTAHIQSIDIQCMYSSYTSIDIQCIYSSHTVDRYTVYIQRIYRRIQGPGRQDSGIASAGEAFSEQLQHESCQVCS